MLTDHEKARLRAEETFREEVRRQLEDEKPRRSFGARLWDRLNSAIVLWLLSSVVVGGLTCYYEDAREDAAAARAEKARKAADERDAAARKAADDREMASRRLAAAIALVPHLSSNAVSERAVALAILKNSPLAAEVYAVAVRQELERPSATSEDREHKAEAAVQWDSGAVQVPLEAARNVPPRLYVHMPVKDDRSADLESIRKALEPRGFVIVPVQIFQPGPDRTDVRYYEIPGRTELEKAKAETIIGILDDEFTDMDRIPNALSKADRVRPWHFELWFGKRQSP